MSRLPKTGELYEDDAHRVYQVVSVARFVETGDQIVVYQAMFGNFEIYARTLRQFAGEDSQKCLFTKLERAKGQPDAVEQENVQAEAGSRAECAGMQGKGSVQTESGAIQTGPGKVEPWPRIQSPAESRRALRQNAAEISGGGDFYSEKRRRQMEEREQRREMFRKTGRHESAAEELRANPGLIRFLEADTYEQKFQVLNEIQDDMTDRLIDDIAVVLDVVIPEGEIHDRFHQLRNIILMRQKYETNRFR